MMKIGTRLTLVLLLAVTPVLLGRLYWSLDRSAEAYISTLKRELRATSRSLVPAMENDVLNKEWNEVDDVLKRMTADGMVVALLEKDDSLMRTAGPGESKLVEKMVAMRSGDRADEFEVRIGASDWFCRIVPLRDSHGTVVAHMLMAQDWTDSREDLRSRAILSVVGSLAVLAVIIALIPILVRRYVSNPLAELSRKVTRFSDDELRGRYPGTDEVRLLTEEFQKLDEQLGAARLDLLAKHRRELELERSLQHAERLATVGTLASGLAHEIGTPMGVIRGRAEQLLNGEASSGKSRKGLEIIITQIDRVSRIVRMLLDYGRSRESQRAVCDVRQILSHASSLLETEAARRKVQIVADLGDRPLFAECDAAQLQQVFVNLEMNALDAMTPQGGTLRIHAEALSNGDAGKLKVVFEDTGSGVAPEDAGRVFDPFFTTKEPGHGTGMGLAVSQSIVRDHEGQISFESGAEGSRFVVTIPGAQPRSTGAAAGKENRP